MRALPLLFALAALTGCSSSAVGVTRFRNIDTIHNPDAGHVWIVQTDPSGNEYVLYCDASWIGQGKPMCNRYPYGYAADGSMQVPGDMSARPPAPVAHPPQAAPAAPSTTAPLFP